MNMAEKRIGLNEAMKQLQEIKADRELKALLFYAEKKRLDELSEKKWKERMIKDRNRIKEDLKIKETALKEKDNRLKEKDNKLKEKDNKLKEKDNKLKDKQKR